jgi:O-acetylhomoserine (thiol)-lyase
MKIETIAVHGGYSPDPTTKAVAVPIYQTTSYAFDDTQHGADLFDLKVAGNIYTRIMNPTQDVLEKRVAAMEGGIAGLAMASGMAAITARSRPSPRPATTSFLEHALRRHLQPVRPHLPAVRHRCPLCRLQRPSRRRKTDRRQDQGHLLRIRRQPAGQHHRLRKTGRDRPQAWRAGHRRQHRPSPYLCRPFEHGADIVVHSLTKYLGGHGNSLGGIIVDSGKFPWAEHKAKFKRLNEPDVSYHGVIYTEALGPAAYIGRARVVPLRNMGAAISPFNAFMILQGIETLALRMDRICENALKIANYLQSHPKVTWVNYAGLPTHKDHALVQKYMGGRASGILSFGVKGGSDGGGKFQDALQLVTRLVNIGDCKTLACHPASTTHRQLSAAEMAKAGVSEDMIRLSVGIEHIDDLIADLDQALNAA